MYSCRSPRAKDRAVDSASQRCKRRQSTTGSSTGSYQVPDQKSWCTRGREAGRDIKPQLPKKRGTMAVLVLSGVKTSQSLTRGRTSTRRNPLHCRRASGCWQHPVRFRRAPTARLYYVKPRPSRRAKSHHNFRITKGPSRVRHSARARAARGHREALRNSNKKATMKQNAAAST